MPDSMAVVDDRVFGFAGIRHDLGVELSDRALLKAGIPAELHIYERGGHGFGLRGRSPDFKNWSVSHWPEHAAQWLAARGFLASKQGD